jgi:hypothetical protein
MNAPIGLFLPKKYISKNPITVGGKTIGIIRKVSSSILPLNFLLYNSLAKKMPKKLTIMTEIKATSRENLRGCQNSYANMIINPIL